MIAVRHLRASLLGLVFVTCLVGCDTSASSDAAATGKTPSHPIAPLPVVCTIGQIGDLMTNVGGDHLNVKTLMGPGVDPHLYRGTLIDTQKLNSAGAVFYNGLHLEGRLSDALENLAGRKPVFAVTEDIVADSPELLRKPPEFEGNYDPHVWFDVSLWAKCVETATQRLVELDPAHADDYRANSAAYIDKLDKLHEWCKTEMASIPKEQRVMITAHDAFGYFGRAYDVEVHGLQGISTADEADLASINHLVDLLVERKIKAVFVESSVPPKNIESLIQGCAARGHTVIEGGELFSDALGPVGTPAANYIGMVEHNVRTIVKALK